MKIIIIMAANKKEAKSIALSEYGEKAEFIKPYRYASRGNNFYEFRVLYPQPNFALIN